MWTHGRETSTRTEIWRPARVGGGLLDAQILGAEPRTDDDTRDDDALEARRLRASMGGAIGALLGGLSVVASGIAHAISDGRDGLAFLNAPALALLGEHAHRTEHAGAMASVSAAAWLVMFLLVGAGVGALLHKVPLETAPLLGAFVGLFAWSVGLTVVQRLAEPVRAQLDALLPDWITLAMYLAVGVAAGLGAAAALAWRELSARYASSAWFWPI